MDKVKESILTDLKDGIKISHSRYELSDENQRLRSSELSMHLLELKKNGYINFIESRVLIPGGNTTKYGNSLRVMYPEDIILEPKGRQYLEDSRTRSITKKSRKVRLAMVRFINDLLKETRKQVINKIATALALIAIAVILFIVFWPAP